MQPPKTEPLSGGWTKPLIFQESCAFCGTDSMPYIKAWRENGKLYCDERCAAASVEPSLSPDCIEAAMNCGNANHLAEMLAARCDENKWIESSQKTIEQMETN